MKLKVKNKWTLTVQRLLREAKAKGVVPRHIEVNDNEVVDLVNELFEHRADNTKAVDISQFSVIVAQEKTPNRYPLQWVKLTSEQFVTELKSGSYILMFDDVEFKVCNELPQVMKPAGPEGKVIRDGDTPPPPSPPKNETVKEWDVD